MRRFLKDYEIMTSADEKGHEKWTAVYKGSYFNFAISDADYQSYRKLSWAVILAMIVLQIGAGFASNRGMYQIYIAVPYVLCFFPLVYLSAGALRLPKTTTHLQRDQAELTVRRIKRSGAALLVLNSLAIVSELVYLAFLNKTPGIGKELIFLALIMPIGVLNALLLMKTRGISVTPE
ncbi:MAG TPA: hypothetical protein PLG84_05300 [Anaerolineaceae bacterium]|nr:hypothetical protein [Anaerolineaceae bacterium]HOE35481.1 hypothetical protein [Anaerolineaceae bacterium]HOT26394.1 hypothetical protein [Anaerolineaceae bacterium]HQH58245.1 hypothetical protein [Anaerolineaceae bacterium]HQK03631.1 hypothetical protein [Anaerolineaceae bacterium]